MAIAATLGAQGRLLPLGADRGQSAPKGANQLHQEFIGVKQHQRVLTNSSRGQGRVNFGIQGVPCSCRHDSVN